MPFIKIKVNSPVSEEQEIALKERMGKAIELVPGKSEEYLLLVLEDNARLWLRGKNTEPAAYLEAGDLRQREPCGIPGLYGRRCGDLSRCAEDPAGESVYQI